MKQEFQKVIAIFNPQRTDNLHDWAKKIIGEKAEFYYAWVIEDGDYTGQWALCSYDLRINGWVPECDLEIIQEVQNETD